MTPKQKIYISLRFLLVSSVRCAGIPLILISIFIPGCVSLASSIETKQPRYLKLNPQGHTLPRDSKTWSCIKDLKTNLVWEVKTPLNRLHTYSWYSESKSNNGGFNGYKNQGRCPLNCDTQAYVNALQGRQLCGMNNWRLPQREELRSLVDYQRPFPGPSIIPELFPNTVGQFYWSATPDANTPDSAWGIGFTFGFDYAYFKSDHGHIRLVADVNHD